MNAAWLVCWVLNASAQDALAEAAQRFNNGDAAGAAEAYQNAVKQGAASADVYFNVGTAALRAGDVGRAVWGLLEARARRPQDADVLFNLELARKANTDTVVGTQESAGDALLQRVPRAPLQYAALVVWWLFCGALVWRGVRGGGPRVAWALRTGGGLFVVLAVLVALVENTQGRPLAVVLPKEVVVRSTEGAGAPEAFRVHAGLTVEPLVELPAGLTRIRLANGLEGFVPSGALQWVGRPL
jgi:hypothetical protein